MLRIVLPCLALLACENPKSTEQTGTKQPDGSQAASYDRNVMLTAIAEKVILPTVREFDQRASELASATSVWEAGGDKTAAQSAWRDAMRVWQRKEMLQVGPAAAAGMFKGGQGLRDQVYSWPTVNPCLIDQEIVRAGYEEPEFFTDRLVNAYGLAVLEYLLFRTDGDNACASFVGIDDQWVSLGAVEIEARRARYASRVAEHVREQAGLLRDGWEPAAGNFTAALATAGKGSAFYPTAQDALNEVFAALYYIELKVKDRKLAIPAGLSSKCVKDSCPELAESPWAEHSKENLKENLVAFQALLRGSFAEGQKGFAYALEGVGESALAASLDANTKAAIAAVDALPGTFEAALTADLPAARSLHVAVKALTDLVKTQLVSALNLRVPQEGAGDND